MEHKIIVVGIGPGSADYLLPIAKRKIEQAYVLIGSRRALNDYSQTGQIIRAIDKDIPSLMAFIRNQLLRSDVVVLVSGDPGYYSLLPALRQNFTDCEFEVIPGISSFQLAFARIGEPWQNATLLSMHGREVTDENLFYQQGRVVSFLTDSCHTPQVIARKLIKQGWPDTVQVYLGEKLSYKQEKIVSLSLAEVTATAGFEHSVMVVKA
jgi:cobalt-precorrin-7 (C5)-methyltransferase